MADFRRAALLALLGVVSTSHAVAEELRVTLEQALQLAESRSPELQAARERAAAQSARGESVKKLAVPRAFVSLAWSRTDNPAGVFMNKLNAGELTPQDFAVDRLNAPGALSHLTSALTLEAPIDLGGRVHDQAAAQASAGRALDAQAREVLLEVRLRVVDTYRRAQVAACAAEVTERALNAAVAREAELEARVTAGAALQADRLRTRARRREREADLAERRGDHEVALATLARAVGAGPDQRFLPVDAPVAPLALTEGEAAWLERALRQRPALAGAREQTGAAALKQHAEGRGLWPELLGFAQLQDDRNTASSGGQSGTLGVALRWSLLDAGRGKRVAAAAADQRAAELDERALGDDVRLGVSVAFRRAEAARQRYAAAAGGADEGREALRVVRERRLAGLATLTDELETEAAALAAELLEVRAAADAALADAALRRAAGEL